MTQLILVYIIIALAIGYTIYSLVKTLRVKSTGGCGDSCGCSAKDEFKKAIKNAKLKKVDIAK